MKAPLKNYFKYILLSLVFVAPLRLGSSGQSVLELQQILNRDPQTQIASSGIGSPGNETTYFGNLTKQAVIRFQNKYASDILSPVGLMYGTGYVGNLTIQKLNSLINPSQGATKPQISIVATSTVTNATSTKIYIPTIQPSNVSISTSTPFIVTEAGTVSVIGTDFKSFGNSVYSGLGVINNLSSPDGKTLTFHVSDFSFFANTASVKNYAKGYILPVPFRIKNTDGLSGNVGMFEVQF